jgi:hypothetical protein
VPTAGVTSGHRITRKRLPDSTKIQNRYLAARKRAYLLDVEEYVGSTPKIENTVAFPSPFG